MIDKPTAEAFKELYGPFMRYLHELNNLAQEGPDTKCCFAESAKTRLEDVRSALTALMEKHGHLVGLQELDLSEQQLIRYGIWELVKYYKELSADGSQRTDLLRDSNGKLEFLQPKGKDVVPIAIKTHKAKERMMRHAFNEINKLAVVKKGAVMIRIQD